jgi:hypothetical protein
LSARPRQAGIGALYLEAVVLVVELRDELSGPNAVTYLDRQAANRTRHLEADPRLDARSRGA